MSYTKSNSKKIKDIKMEANTEILEENMENIPMTLGLERT